MVRDEHHLLWVLRGFVAYYNQDRPHRTLGLETPKPRRRPARRAQHLVDQRGISTRRRVPTPGATAVHERIVLRGLEPASQRGVTGVTLGDLADRAAMSKSGHFAHFRSKDELQIELLRATAATIAREVVEPALRAGEFMRLWLACWGTRWVTWRMPAV